MRKFIVTLFASASLAACAASGLTGEGNNRSISPVAAQSAAQQHQAVLAEFGGAVTGPTADYVTGIGRRVAAQSGIQGAGTGVFNFTVLNSPVPNAFAVPGGYIYITRGLLTLMNSEAELAAVLGHEIAHVTADHSRSRQNRGLLTQLGVLAAGVLTGSGTAAQAAGTIGQSLLLGYSRGQEHEADDIGIRYAAAAGFNADAAASIFTQLDRATQLEAQVQGRADQRSLPSWARTHPVNEERVRRARALGSQLQPGGAGIVGREELLRRVDGLVYGDDPTQGVIEGREFLHPDLRLAFTAPQGYAIQNGTRAVSVSGQGGQAQFSTGTYSGNLESYIAQVFRSLGGEQTQIAFSRPERTNINGIPAAASTARVQTQQGLVDVSVVAYEFGSNQAYHIVTLTPAGGGFGPFAGMIQSVRRLTAQQAAAIRPRVVDVVTVGPRDTVASLAARMAFSDFREERFRVLNGLAAGEGVRPGQQVKLVVYGQRR